MDFGGQPTARRVAPDSRLVDMKQVEHDLINLRQRRWAFDRSRTLLKVANRERRRFVTGRVNESTQAPIYSEFC
jgi:hypothetical protein